MIAKIADKLGILYCRKALNVTSDLLQVQYGIAPCIIPNRTDVDLDLKIHILEYYNQFTTMSSAICLKKILNE